MDECKPLVRGVPVIQDLLFNGNYRDFDQQWYADIGAPLMLTMLINTLAPAAGNLLVELHTAARRCRGRAAAYTQKTLNDAYTGYGRQTLPATSSDAFETLVS